MLKVDWLRVKREKPISVVIAVLVGGAGLHLFARHDSMIARIIISVPILGLAVVTAVAFGLVTIVADDN